MSFTECVTNAVKAKDITKEQADETLELYQEVQLDLLRQIGPDQAQVAAGKIAYDIMAADIAQRKRVRLMSMNTFYRNREELDALVKKGMRPGKALQEIVQSRGGYGNDLYYTQRTIRRSLVSQMSELLAAHRLTLTGGQRDKAGMLDIVKALYGDESNVFAKQLADAWIAVAETARKRANDAGMRIPKLDNWRLPQTHEQLKVTSVDKDEWINYTFDRLDMAAMTNTKTGLPFNEQTLKQALGEMYESIKDPFSDVLPGTSPRGKSLANQRTDHRFLVFRNAEGWMQYQERFGNPNVFETMMKHLDEMAKDIALLEVLGPNPKAMAEALKVKARSDAAQAGGKANQKVSGDIQRFEELFDHFNYGEKTRNMLVAQSMGGFRDIMSSAKLGGAPISALADFNTQRVQANLVGMPTTKLMTRIFKEMPQGKEGVAFAARMGVTADAVMQTLAAQARYADDTMSPRITRRIADTTHRLSGLTGLTRAGQQAWGIEFQGFLADQAGKSFSDLAKSRSSSDKMFFDTLVRNGVTADEWNTARSTKLHSQDGASFLRVNDIADRADLNKMARRRLSTKMMNMILREGDRAVPVPTLRSRTLVVGRTERGTFAGEAMRAVGMFRSFPVAIIMNNLVTYATLSNKASRARFTADFIISSTVVGGMLYQAKQIVSGRDPRDMGDLKFWQAAILQGGGLGIFGDFLFADYSRFGRSPSTEAVGPVGGFADDIVKLAKNIGEDRFGSDLINFLWKNAPGNRIWYLRLLAEREIINRLEEMANPDITRRWQNNARRHERETGQGSIYAKGTSIFR